MRFYWRQAEVEARAWGLLREYQARCGGALSPPVDVDLVGELARGLTWDWDTIPEPPGKIIWAGLHPEERRIVLNETHAGKFRGNAGLERFTKAHEIGHWELHVAPVGARQPAIPGLAPEGPLYCRGAQKSWLERHADWFAAALLMPAPLFVPTARRLNLLDAAGRHALRERFNVSLAALSVRLKSLGFAYVDDHGALHGPEAVSRSPAPDPARAAACAGLAFGDG
jgi:hypothetical protein